MEKDPPGLSPSDIELRSQIRVLERNKANILQERLRLERQLQYVQERLHCMCVLSNPPPL